MAMALYCDWNAECRHFVCNCAALICFGTCLLTYLLTFVGHKSTWHLICLFLVLFVCCDMRYRLEKRIKLWKYWLIDWLLLCFFFVMSGDDYNGEGRRLQAKAQESQLYFCRNVASRKRKKKECYVWRHSGSHKNEPVQVEYCQEAMTTSTSGFCLFYRCGCRLLCSIFYSLILISFRLTFWSWWSAHVGYLPV